MGWEGSGCKLLFLLLKNQFYERTTGSKKRYVTWKERFWPLFVWLSASAAFVIGGTYSIVEQRNTPQHWNRYQLHGQLWATLRNKNERTNEMHCIPGRHKCTQNIEQLLIFIWTMAWPSNHSTTDATLVDLPTSVSSNEADYLWPKVVFGAAMHITYATWTTLWAIGTL